MVSIYKIKPNYPKSLKKMSKKNRKPCDKTDRDGVLEYGKTGIIFTLPNDMFEELETWWEWNTVLTEGQFDVILNPADDKPFVELMFVDNTPFYKGRDNTQENTSECPDVIAQSYYKSLPEWIRGAVKDIYVCDYNYISRNEKDVVLVGEVYC